MENDEELRKMLEEAMKSASDSIELEKKAADDAKKNGESEQANAIKEMFEKAVGIDPKMSAIFDSMMNTSNAGSANSKNHTLNLKVALKSAHDTLGFIGNNVIAASTSDRYRKAVQGANLMLDTQTDFNVSSAVVVKVMRPTDWVDETMGSWERIVVPIVKSSGNQISDMIQDQMDNMKEMFEEMGIGENDESGPTPSIGFDFNGVRGALPVGDDFEKLGDVFSSLHASSSSLQIGSIVGNLAKEAFGGTDYYIPLFDNAIVLIPQNVEQFAKDNDLDLDETIAFLALREVALARLFLNNKWLRAHILSIMQKYSEHLEINMQTIEQGMLDEEMPESIEDIKQMLEDRKDEIMPTSPEQLKSQHDLEQILALIEGWVDHVSFRAGAMQIKNIAKMREVMARRRVLGTKGEKQLYGLIRMKLTPTSCVKAVQMWDKLALENGDEGLDKYWKHPDTVIEEFNNYLVSIGEELPKFDAKASQNSSSSGAFNSNTTSSTETTADSGFDWDELL